MSTYSNSPSQNCSQPSSIAAPHILSYGSYRRHFLNEVPDDLQCPLCYDSPVNCQTYCHHAFCSDCLQNHICCSLKSRQFVSCPLCREPLSIYTVKQIDGDLLKRVGELIVACGGESDGCNMSGPLVEVEKHEKVCDSVMVTCRYRAAGCTLVPQRKNALAHESRCRYNPGVRACKYQIHGCKVRGMPKTLRYHEARCIKRNMDKRVCCPNWNKGCGLMVRKYFLQNHLQNCLFAERDEPSDPADHIIEISFSWRSSKRRYSLHNVKEKLSKIFPNIKELKEGRIIGEFTTVFYPLPLSALKNLLLACNPKLSDSLREMNIIQKGVNVYRVDDLTKQEEI